MPDAITVQGRATYLIVPVTVIALCAVGAPLLWWPTPPGFA